MARTEYLGGRITLWQGDCLDSLDAMAPLSLDACVTDPPYGIDFLGNEWDESDNVAFQASTWRRVLRVLKPGAHLLAFSADRTYHRMAAAIEAAGFEVRGMCTWNYANGYPKNLDIAKELDSLAGVQRKVIGEQRQPGMAQTGAGSEKRDLPPLPLLDPNPVTDLAKKWDGWGTALKPSLEPICVARKPLYEKLVARNVARFGTGAINIKASRIGDRIGQKTVSTGEVKAQSIARAGPDYGRVATGATTVGRWPANFIHDGSRAVVEAFPNPDLAQFFFVAKAGADDRIRRPSETVTVEWAKGQSLSLDIDDAALRTKGEGASRAWDEFLSPERITALARDAQTLRVQVRTNSFGPTRTWTAWCDALAADGIEPKKEMVGGGNSARFMDSERRLVLTAPAAGLRTPAGLVPRGGTLRIVLRAVENGHSTVKPVTLMRYLVRLVTPPGGTVLDLFAGTGTTGEGALLEGFRAVLCEREVDYARDIVARLRRYHERQKQQPKAPRVPKGRPIEPVARPREPAATIEGVRAETGRIGTCCVVLHPSGEPNTEFAFRTLNRANYLKQGDAALRATTMHNLGVLHVLVAHLARGPARDRMFRMGNGVLPLLTLPQAQGVWRDKGFRRDVEAALAVVGYRAKTDGVRLSLHPDQFIVPNSASADVRASSVRELDSWAEWIEAMSLDERDGFCMNVHLGPRHDGDLRTLGRSWVQARRDMSAGAWRRLTIENPDVVWTATDLLRICLHVAQRPVVDVHHHWCMTGRWLESGPLSTAVLQSWSGRRPKIHLSLPKGKHIPREGGLDARGLPVLAACVDNPREHALMPWAPGVGAYARGLLEWADVVLELKGKDAARSSLWSQVESPPKTP